ncbi:MAG: FAD:protein FMN transferase [Candidatus Omnitrophica bacterium]|nr:FAD:protein FMN transferase [Candidatus Omnitrophota bacterium]
MIRKLLVLILLIFLVACSKPLYKNKFVIAGTYLEVTSPNPEASNIVYSEFRRLNKIFNAFDSESEISVFNRTYAVPFKASDDLIEILELSKKLTDLTEGSFDVSRGILYKFWKRLIKKTDQTSLPSQTLIEQIRDLGGISGLEIDLENQTIKINKKGVVIDLGAIAKGYMVDKAVLKLKAKGVKSALINAGGDMYCLGKKYAKPWQVGVRDPRERGQIIETKVIVNQSIATSGNYEQFFDRNGKRYSHLIDPRTGYPASSNIISVSVIAESCAVADALATAFFISGREGIEKFLIKNPSLAKIFIVEEGGIVTSYE